MADKNIKDDDIDRMFRRIVEKIGDVDDGTHRMFRLLVEATLKYRDDLKDAGKGTLTVGETQAALDAFMEVMKTHRLPENLNGHAQELVIRWLEEIKKSVHH